MFDELQNWVNEHRHRFNRIGVAFSGGRDSSALIHALAILRDQTPFSLFAIHINHGLMKNAVQWQEFCASVCERLAIPLQIIPLSLTITAKDSVEEVARIARYRAFATQLNPGDVLCTAHHLSDQAETFLLQLARGSGLNGLCGIAASKSCGQGTVARPLLNISQKQINQFIAEFNIPWVEDDSNHNYEFKRNYIRHELLPIFATMQPAIAQCIHRSMQHIKDATSVLNDYLSADLKTCLDSNGHLELNLLKQRTSQQQIHLLRLWLAQSNLRAPNTKKLQEIYHQFLNAQSDKKPMLTYEGVVIHRFQDKLSIHSNIPKSFSPQPWELTKSCVTLSNGQQLKATRVMGRGIVCHKIPDAKVWVRPRQGGEICRLANETFSRKLKKVLHEAQIPHWLRMQIPLLFCQDELIAVPHVYVSRDWQAKQNEEGWEIQYA